MSRWPDKYVIALTGNIATGKSVVRRMLEHLGVFGIDADALSHQSMARSGPAYAPVVKMFGEWLLTPAGEVDRALLGRLVFSEPAALARLEAIVHPFVGHAVDILVKRAKASVIAIEAVKIIETRLAEDCNSLWVVNAPPMVQVERLMAKRKLSREQAELRLAAQPPQAEKLKSASAIIQNDGAFEATWLQVQAAYNQITMPIPIGEAPTQPVPAVTAATVITPARLLRVRRGRPNDSSVLAAFIQQATGGQRAPSRADVMAAFGEKAYLLVERSGEVAALAGWQVENLVTRVDELYFAPGATLTEVAPPLLEAVESASRELQSEAALIFLTPALTTKLSPVLEPAGYTPRTPDSLGVAAWQEAATASMPAGGTVMLFKKLREDRILRPV